MTAVAPTVDEPIVKPSAPGQAPPVATRTLRVGGRSYPVYPPSIRDARLHNSMGLAVVHVCGQLQFGWELSIVQLLLPILTCALIEVAVTFRRKRVIAWPAGALLTGNGIALLLRANGTVHGDWWSTNGWYYFVGVAALAMAGKYLITLNGRHIFNPSNVVLVAAFLALGTTRVNPQDFWFGPLSPGLVITYAALLGVGTLVTRRLGLFSVAFGFWVAFTAGLGALALAGHAMSARWHFGPVTGMTFWWTIVSSPEVFIFAFFMITDPRTVPTGRVARLLFGVGVGVTSSLLLAPQQTEFSAKVGFLGGLTLLTALWPLVIHRLPAAGTPEDDPLAWLRRVVLGGSAPGRHPALAGLRVSGAGLSLSVGLLAIVLAGIPARPTSTTLAAVHGRPSIDVPASDLPAVEISDEFRTVMSSFSQTQARQVAADVLADLEIERRAVAGHDRKLAATAAAGDRLTALQAEIAGSGPAVALPEADLDGGTLVLIRDNPKAIPRLGLEVTGTAGGKPLATTIELVLAGDTYLIADVAP